MALRTRKRTLGAVSLLLALYLWYVMYEAIVRSRPSVNHFETQIANGTLGFQQIFVINLPARSDRRDALSLAAALTNVSLTYVPGIDGADVPERVLPADARNRHIRKGNIGSWRAHVNVLRKIVEQDLSTALILEDDVDWDVRLKPQLQLFSLAARTYLDAAQGSRGAGTAATTTLSAAAAHALPAPSATPYGDGWDVLWLGHCGATLPGATGPRAVLLPHDATVPAPGHLRAHPFAGPDALAAAAAAHTRVVHAARGNACTVAYAVSRRGARRLLHALGVASFARGYDLMLRGWCDADADVDAGPNPVCLTVQPPLFGHYAGPGGSDIQGLGGGFARREGSLYVRLSIRRNLGRLVAGVSADGLEDQWPDPPGPGEAEEQKD